MVFLSKTLFTDASSSVRPSQKLSVRRVGPFKVLDVINKNAVGIELPETSVFTQSFMLNTLLAHIGN